MERELGTSIGQSIVKFFISTREDVWKIHQTDLIEFLSSVQVELSSFYQCPCVRLSKEFYLLKRFGLACLDVTIKYYLLIKREILKWRQDEYAREKEKFSSIMYPGKKIQKVEALW